MAAEDFEYKPTYDRFGNLQTSQDEANKANFTVGYKSADTSISDSFAKASNNAWANSTNKLKAYHEKMEARELEVLQEVGNILETKEKHGKECTDACN